MKIRATTKLLNISGIKSTKDESEPCETLPGEWYAGIMSLLRPGKFAVHFLHYPTYISIFIPVKFICLTITTRYYPSTFELLNQLYANI